MINSSWRRATRDMAYKVGFSEEKSRMELNIPSHFRCPISLDLMKDPVTLPTGITYDRESIEKWIESGNVTCPVTNQILQSFDQIPNHSIRRMIQDWCVENRSCGVERIPTPRIPITLNEVSHICSKILAASQRRDLNKCTELIKKMKSWARESERNRKCIVESGAGFVLSACFESFSSVSMNENKGLLGEILSILPWIFPLGSEGKNKLGSPSSLRGMAWFLKGDDLSFKQNVALTLKELFSSDRKYVDAFVEIEGVDEALVRIIKQKICPKSTKASLMVIHHMISPSNTSEKITRRFVESGLIPLVLEMVVSGERSICEKALGVLDHICNFKLGLGMLRDHALTLPACVKKILRVSNTATEFSVSILWKLLINNEDGFDDHLIEEALHFGCFQKLLVVLQVGCSPKAKAKTNELLKMLNQHRDRLGCSDPLMVYKHLNRM